MTKRRPPKFTPSKEELDKFTDYLVSGKSQAKAIKLMGWQASSYYHRKGNDPKFAAKIEQALALKDVENIEADTEAFLSHLEKGMDITVAVKAVGWPTSSYYNRKKADTGFSRQVDAAIASYEAKVHESKLALITKQNPRVVVHELQRLDAKNNRASYRQALEDAMKKAISELDFEKAATISKQIEGL